MPFQTQPSREEWLARSQAGEIDVPPVWLAWTRRWFETSTLSLSHSAAHLLRADQGRSLAACRAPRSRRSGKLGSRARRRMDRDRPAAQGRRAVQVAERQRDARPLRRDALAAVEGVADRIDPHVLLRPAGVGVDRAAVRPAPRARDPSIDPGADRPRPARDRRRDLGEADVGRAEPRPGRPAQARQPGRTPARRGIRSSSSAPSRCCGCSPACASTRSSASGSARSAGRPHPTTTADGERVCLLDVPTNKTTSAFTKPVDRLVGEAIEAWQAVRPAAAEVPGSQDRRAGRHAARLPRRAARREVHQPGARPAAVPQGRRPRRGRPRRDHQPPRPGDDRHPALQRQGPDVAVRAAGLARTLQPQLDPALRADHAAHPDQGLHRRRVLRPERPHDRGPARPRRDHQRHSRPAADRSSSTTSGTATAPTASSSNARTGWRAPAATSTSRNRPARRSCSKPRTDCSGCSSRSRSPTTNAPRSKATSPPSTG